MKRTLCIFALLTVVALLAPLGQTTPPAGVRVRELMLSEVFDSYGRLTQMLGTATERARAYMDTATETPRAGTTEVWRIFNHTPDTHPIHFHLVNAQILSRQRCQMGGQRRGMQGGYEGPPAGPAAIEQGWKETVRMNPHEATTVIMKFDLPAVPFKVPRSPRTGGNEYVWHCHILEHEEHDMMRPLVIY